MTTPEGLARIDRVNLREIWRAEAADFTPWLAENIDLLGEALGMDLELEAREAPVGTYSLDILARDLGSGAHVVIENQLETTDHTHLGQLLTYMAGFDAKVVVWVAREFRDEHREALDILNHRTGEDTQFFGVEIEVWRIGDSQPAPNFKLVSTPNEWGKRTASQARGTGAVSKRNERYQAFFQALIDTLREEHRFTNARKGQPQSWYYFSAGHGQRAQFGAAFIKNSKVRIELYLDSDRDSNKSLFDLLIDSKDAIESDFGGALDWERLDEYKASRISIVRQGSITDDDKTLEEIRHWMVTNLLKFREVFSPRLDDLTRQI